EVSDVRDASHRTQCDFRGTRDEVPATDLDVLALDRDAYLMDREAVGIQAVGGWQLLNLSLSLAVEAYGAHIRVRFEIMLDSLVVDFGDLYGRTETVHRKGQDWRGIRIDFLNLRRLGVARELADDRGNFVADVLGGRFDITFEEERDAHAR